MYFNKTPFILKYIFRNVTWNISESDEIFLTFDDGPSPESTPHILKALRDKSIRATFFCLGSQVEKYPDLLRNIRKEGHHIGNHGYHHFSGWHTPFVEYLENIKKADKLISSKLFRPPYGKLTYRQYANISKNKNIIMWDVMPGDFDNRSTKEMVLNRYNKYTSQGSIVALHDNIKSLENVLYTINNLSNKHEFRDLGFLDT
ncbi:MAG: polysaccharide deacetylase family protein [Saprospiraceae bacterium]|nr:polysaccharide deacetylase family protein [Bacteroidia bacterium]NNE15401.1 polysaccharide deacetylase family protein [Saprospiraceae bacterium]NNL92257.1 polysaccharide deacetylase family protein [Saprospiraceae bacterium]